MTAMLAWVGVPAYAVGPAETIALSETNPQKAIQLVTFRSHSRLVLNVDEGVDPVWKTDRYGFELTLKGLLLSDLGAPLGLEEAWAREIEQELKDPRLASLQLLERNGALVLRGRWNFPTGEDAPAEPAMERFDYRQKEPVRYVVDFWMKSGPTVAEARYARERALREAERRRAEIEADKRRQRRIASLRKRESVEDLTTFCREPLKEGTDVFLEFVPFHIVPEYTQWLPSTTPDSSYDYYLDGGTDVRSAPGPDASFVRTALQLYKEGKFGLAVKTIEMFEADHPKSQFRPEMRFLRANALIKLGHEAQALPILRELVARQRASAVSLHAAMYLAGKHAKANETLQALESFLWLTTHYGSHRLNWVFHLGAAEQLFKMRQATRAAQEYQWIVDNAPEKRDQAYAAFRIGDLFVERKQYERALAAYFEALQKFPAEAEQDPGVYLNRAEVLYWIGDRQRATEGFRSFLERFANHPAAWRATYRLGELAGRVATPESQAESRKWFGETINRYPYSPGATLARLALLPCGDHGLMTLESARRFLDGDALKFDGANEVVMNRYPDFRAIQRIRALVTYDQFESAVEAALEELGRSEMRFEGRKFAQRVIRPAFRKALLANLDSGREYEALSFYRRHSSQVMGVPAENDVTPTDYLLRLSRVAANLGMAEASRDISKAYEKIDSRRAAERKLAQESDSPKDPVAKELEEIERERKASEKSFAEARSLWIQEGSGLKKKIAQEEKIRELLSQVSDETSFSYPKELLLGLLDDKAGRAASALSHAQKARLLVTSEEHRQDVDRLDAWIASLHAKAGDPRAAVDLYRQLEKRVAQAGEKRKPAGEGVASALGVPPFPRLEDLIVAEGEVLASTGQWGEAAQAYARAVEAGLGGNRTKFEYARALTKTGSDEGKAKARKVLEEMAASKKDDFWRKLAAESLARQGLEN
jgi:tetratricopeptide (TPR) repeat protein